MKKSLPRTGTTPYPSVKRRMLTYETLDAVFKFTKNPDYYRLPAQVNQNAMRKTFHAWKSFFAALKDFDAHPEKYKERPRHSRLYQGERGDGLVHEPDSEDLENPERMHPFLYRDQCDCGMRDIHGHLYQNRSTALSRGVQAPGDI